MTWRTTPSPIRRCGTAAWRPGSRCRRRCGRCHRLRRSRWKGWRWSASRPWAVPVVPGRVELHAHLVGSTDMAGVVGVGSRRSTRRRTRRVDRAQMRRRCPRRPRSDGPRANRPACPPAPADSRCASPDIEASESSMMAAISAGARRQFTATFTAPMSEPPKRKSKYAMPLRSRNAIRSPTSMPSRSAACATRQATSNSSAHVRRSSPRTNISSIGLRRARWRINPATV